MTQEDIDKEITEMVEEIMAENRKDPNWKGGSNMADTYMPSDEECRKFFETLPPEEQAIRRARWEEAKKDLGIKD